MAEVTPQQAAALPGEWEYYNTDDSAWYSIGKQQQGGTDMVIEKLTKPVKYEQRGEHEEGHLFLGHKIAARTRLREFSGQIFGHVFNCAYVSNIDASNPCKFSMGFGSGVPVGKNLIGDVISIRFTPDSNLGNVSDLRILITAAEILGNHGFRQTDTEEMGWELMFQAQWNSNNTAKYELMYFGHKDHVPSEWTTPTLPSAV